MPDYLSFKRFVLTLLVSGLLAAVWTISGCSGHFPERTETLETEKKLPDNWSMNGRLSISNEDENWYSRFHWVQQGDDFYIRFMGPLGQTELELRQVGNSIQLKTPSYERRSNDLEALLLQETGWRFPLKSMRYWALGRANPDKTARVKRREQLVTGITQSGWHIEYPRYMQINEYHLPKKIIVTDPQVKIKIIVTDWSFEASTLTSLSLVNNSDSFSD